MIEQMILSGIVLDEGFSRKVIPHLRPEYFSDPGQRAVLDIAQEYITTYNALPSVEVLAIELSNKKGLSSPMFDSAAKVISDIKLPEDTEWLVKKAEEFCQDRAIHNALLESIKIVESKEELISRGAIPKILSEALSVCFDTEIGHDLLDDWEKRFDFYHAREERTPFDLEYLNKITKGGAPRKTLNIILAGTGVGKSLAMCHLAAYNLVSGLNVLYLTLEMAEEKIAQRVDANLLDCTLDEIEQLPKDAYAKKIGRLQNKTTGKLIVKQFPTASAHSGHFRHLINELKMKKSFVPDVIYVDYLNVCASARIKAGAQNSYFYVKAIAEELRGLAIEFNVPVWSATQTTRTGFSNSDIGLEDTSESFGLPATADLMIALITSEELEGINQVMVKQLKNRYGDINSHKRFVLGVDRAKMRLYDVEQSAQEGITDRGASSRSKPEPDVPLFDKSTFGSRDSNKRKVNFDFDFNG